MIEQRTLEWHRERQGCFTASEIGNLMVSGRKKDEMFGETAKSYITTVVADRLVSPDIVDDDYEYALYLEENHPTTRAMQWGTDHEDDARNRYADNTGFKVELAPSIKHSEIEYFSCSPDGMVGTDGLVEIKCQQPKNFTESAYAILTGGDLKDINRMYYWQVQAQMCITGRKWCDFVLYHPKQQPYFVCTRIERNEEDIATLMERVKAAETIAEERVKVLRVKDDF